MTATVLLVHGAWHGAWCWAPLQAALDARGIPSLAVDLPGHGLSLDPLGDLYGDAQHVVDSLARVAPPVVLVGHSYGGAVITEAAARRPDGLAHLVYLTAFCLDEGEAVLPFAREYPSVALAGALRPSADGTTSTLDPAAARPALYGQCLPLVADAAVARLGPQPLASFVQPVTAAPWRAIPSTYVRCTLDGSIHLDCQDAMAARCGHVVTLDADHSPFASRTVETADLIEAIVREVTA